MEEDGVLVFLPLVSEDTVMSKRGGAGGIGMQLSEVKFLDLLQTHEGESICPGRFP